MRSQLCLAEESEDSDAEFPQGSGVGDRDSKKGLGPRVYTNCAAFLSLKTEGPAGEADALDALDATRIHPTEGSSWLSRLCRDALEAHQGDKKEATAKDPPEETEEEAIAEVLKDPSMLEGLDLEAFVGLLKDEPEGCRMLSATWKRR
ncbi:suppressor of Ty 6 homolog [Cyclospora cayetanensis]|uniref:Suppressor of Ty 6 homolog n=1 Tax=Cyclospora cayetanensis TaxID=88456 RepID=A0A6P6S4U1_9EIME|nr:suppressor of Ty 6 homolog [Cyclospora cayetanensis]